MLDSKLCVKGSTSLQYEKGVIFSKPLTEEGRQTDLKDDQELKDSRQTIGERERLIFYSFLATKIATPSVNYSRNQEETSKGCSLAKNRYLCHMQCFSLEISERVLNNPQTTRSFNYI